MHLNAGHGESVPNVPVVFGNAEKDRYHDVRIDSQLGAIFAAMRFVADRQHTLLQELV